MSLATRLEPVVWQPPEAPPRARQTRGNRPWPGVRLLELPGEGPEDVVCDADGVLYTGLYDGRILRVEPGHGTVDVVADTQGRPLGLEVCPDRTLLVCDDRRGLLQLDPQSGDVRELVTSVDGEPLVFTSNVACANDGTVYFTSSTRRYHFDDWMADLFEHTGTGRLMCRSPDGRVQVLLDDLHFPNGVALATDGSFLMFAQTGLYSVSRYWLAGPRAGEVEIVADNMPGFPDNMCRGSDGLFWVAIASPRNPLLDRLHAMAPVYRRLVHAMPKWMRPGPVRTTWVLAYDAAGNLVHDLQGPDAGFALATGVCEHDGMLYLGSMTGNSLAVLPTPTTAPGGPLGGPVK